MEELLQCLGQFNPQQAKFLSNIPHHSPSKENAFQDHQTLRNEKEDEKTDSLICLQRKHLLANTILFLFKSFCSQNSLQTLSKDKSLLSPLLKHSGKSSKEKGVPNFCCVPEV